ncbi:MAG TPA: hypothetical protein VIU15_40755 [Streptomyces sp.]
MTVLPHTDLFVNLTARGESHTHDLMRGLGLQDVRVHDDDVEAGARLAEVTDGAPLLRGSATFAFGLG